MDRSSLVPAIIALLLLTACFAGCSDSSSPDSTASASTPVPTTGTGALYSAGDIVKNPKSSSGTALLIISYDSVSDSYERAYIYPNSDGSWGYRLDSKTDKISRSIIEKVYTVKTGTVSVSAVPVRTPTTEPTAVITTAATTTTTTTTVTTTTTSAFAPRVKNIDPFKGTAGTTVTITNIDGQYFVSPTNVTLKKTGATTIKATDVSTSDILIKCKFVIPADAVTGYYNLVVTNPDGQSDEYQNAFLVKEGDGTSTTTSTVKVPTITQIQDTLLVTGGMEGYKTVGILGTNLTSAANMKLVSSTSSSTTITATTYNCGSESSATGHFNIPNSVTGNFYVTLVNAGGTELSRSSGTLTIQ